VAAGEQFEQVPVLRHWFAIDLFDVAV